MKLLIENGADVNNEDSGGWWALPEAIRWKQDLEVIQLLNKAGSKFENEYQSSLFDCPLEKHPRCLDLAKMLIEAGANINWCNSDGIHGLFYCHRWMGIDLFKLLLDHGADIDTKGPNQRYSFLDIAICNSLPTAYLLWINSSLSTLTSIRFLKPGAELNPDEKTCPARALDLIEGSNTRRTATIVFVHKLKLKNHKFCRTYNGPLWHMTHNYLI